MSELDSDRKARFAALDGLRGVAILLVVFAHLAGTRRFPVSLNQIPASPLFMHVFFVLSGYLITRILVGRTRRSVWDSLCSFYVRRLSRIVPAFALYLGVLWLLARAGVLATMNIFEWQVAALYVLNFFRIHTWELGHLWSLAVEEQFYITWPLILIVVGPRKAARILAGYCLVAPLLRAAWLYVHPERAYLLTTASPLMGDAIAVGCLLALESEMNWLGRVRRRLVESPLMMIVPVVTIWPIFLGAHPRIYQYVGVSVTNVGLAVCLSWLLEKPRSLPGRFLASATLVFIGRLSYSLYLWQQLFLNRHSSAWFCAFPVNLAAAGLVAYASSRFVEWPTQVVGHRLADRWFGKRPAKDEERKKLVIELGGG